MGSACVKTSMKETPPLVVKEFTQEEKHHMSLQRLNELYGVLHHVGLTSYHSFALKSPQEPEDSEPDSDLELEYEMKMEPQHAAVTRQFTLTPIHSEPFSKTRSLNAERAAAQNNHHMIENHVLTPITSLSLLQSS